MGKMAAITGGVLMVFGSIGLAALWWAVLHPAVANNSLVSNLYALLRLLEEFGVLTFPWTDVIFGLTWEQLFWILIYITSIPVTQVNFFNMIWVDINLCVFALATIIIMGGLASFASARED